MHEYYQPPNVFRQPAILVKKRQDNTLPCLQLETHKKSWQNDISRIGSPLLRKASGDMNDFYTTQQLRSDYWAVSSPDPTILTTSLSTYDESLLVSNTSLKDNLKLFQLKNNDKKSQLYELQSISVPGGSTVSACLLPSSYSCAKQEDHHNQLLLSGHQDGIVNLIATSTQDGNAKIIKRFNHGKYLKSTDPDSLDTWLKGRRSLPIKQIKPWNSKGFISVVNESMFIYDLNQHRTPLYLQSFGGLEALDANPTNPHLLALVGSQFGENGISLLDLRNGQGHGNLYSPDSVAANYSSISRDCAWLNEHTVANAVGNCVKLWDIRATGVKCTVVGHKGSVQSIKYHEESKRLYTSDDQGYAIAWDLDNIDSVKECRLATGFNSIGVESLADVKQCGNIVVSPDMKRMSSFTTTHDYDQRTRGSQFLDTLANGSLVTLDSKELGLHAIHNIQRPVVPPRNPRRLLGRPEQDVVESDTTLHHESSSSNWEEASDGTLECDEFTTPVKAQDEPLVLGDIGMHEHKPSFYSLKDTELSGSTICHEHLIREEIFI